MKKSFLAYAVAAFAALGCSSVSQLQTQVYDDGVYTRPSVVPSAQVAVANSDLDNLLAESKQSQAYIINSQGDTLVVPAGKKVQFTTTTDLTVVESPSWLYDYSWAYSPWYFRDFYYWHSPWFYNSWYFDRWAWDLWYYDYWYYHPFYPFRAYSWSFWYDPFYSPWYHYTWYGPFGRHPYFYGGYYHGPVWGGGGLVHNIPYAGQSFARGGSSRSAGRSLTDRHASSRSRTGISCPCTTGVVMSGPRIRVCWRNSPCPLHHRVAKNILGCRNGNETAPSESNNPIRMNLPVRSCRTSSHSSEDCKSGAITIPFSSISSLVSTFSFHHTPVPLPPQSPIPPSPNRRHTPLRTCLPRPAVLSSSPDSSHGGFESSGPTPEVLLWQLLSTRKNAAVVARAWANAPSEPSKSWTGRPKSRPTSASNAALARALAPAKPSASAEIPPRGKAEAQKPPLFSFYDAYRQLLPPASPPHSSLLTPHS